MNIADSERLEAALQGVGYTPAAHPEDASFIVLNSCSVRASAEQRIIGKLHDIRRIKQQHPSTRIVLWGCMVGQHNQSPFQAQLPMVDYFVSPSAVDEVVALAPNPLYQLDEPALPVRDWSTPPVTVYIPIQYGCNMRCSYCVIPLRRGNERSRPLATICQEVAEVVARGAQEVVLLGQIVDSWGHDLPDRPNLSMLLRAVHATPGLQRLRFLTSHPAWMTQQLIDTVATLPLCQPEMNLPVQAAHNDLLTRMHRGYTIEQYRNLVYRIRHAMPHIAITTDIIVGHPGETAHHVACAVDLLNELRFDKVHIAAFSARPGTLAATEESDTTLAVPTAEKQARRQLLENTQKRIATDINATLYGKTVDILVDALVKGKWRGRTGTNKLVYFDCIDQTHTMLGQCVPITITRTSPWSLYGTIAQSYREKE